MKCARCGNELFPQDQFCGACGALRSRLPPRFAEVEGRFAVLQDRYRRGELNAAAYEAALRELIIQDDQGQYWMLGADSGAWYLYDGTQWVPQDPAQEVAILPPPPPPPTAVRRRFPWLWAILVLVVLLVAAAAVIVWQFPSLLPFDLGWWPPATVAPTTAVPTMPPTPTLTAVPSIATSTPTRMPIVAPTAGPTSTPTSSPTPTPTPTQTPRPIFRYYFPLCGR